MQVREEPHAPELLVVGGHVDRQQVATPKLSVTVLGISLALVFILILATFALSSLIQADERKTISNLATLVNTAGRQRMLSQRICKNALLLNLGNSRLRETEEVETQLSQSAIFLRDRQADLRQELTHASATAQSRNLYRLVDQAEPLVQSLSRLGLRASKTRSLDSKDLTSLLDADQLFVPLMDELNQALATEASLKQEKNQRTLGYCYVVVLALLVGIAGFITIPFFRSYQRFSTHLLDLNSKLSQLATVAEKTSNIVVVTDVDRKIIWVNSEFINLTGYSASEAIGKTPGELLQCPATSPETVQYIRDQLRQNKSVKCEILNQRKDGSHYWVNLCIDAAYDEAGTLTGFVAIETEISDIVNAREMLEKRQIIMEKTGELASIGGWEIDLATHVLTWSTEVKRIHEVPEDYEPTVESAIGFYAPEARSEIKSLVLNAIEQGSSFDTELPLITRTGKHIWVRALGSVLKQGGVATKVYGAFQDITEKRKLSEELRSAAHLDKLTGLPNRASIQSAIQKVFEQSNEGEPKNFAVLFIDMDRFKAINDSLGHEIGDLLLLEVAKRLRHCLRQGDELSLIEAGSTAARLGGDEFIVLLENMSSDFAARSIADRILTVLSKPYLIKGHTVHSTASIGIALSASNYSNSSELIRDADIAMYEAKAAGKGRVILFEPNMHLRIQVIRETEIELREAINSNQFVLHYQPIIDLKTGDIRSCEALVRWNHPKRGLVFPSEFVEIAEETGLIVPMGTWVLKEACRQFMDWRSENPAAAPQTISVNVSRRQLFEPGFSSIVASTIIEVGIPPECLDIEITEYGVMHDVDQAVRTLNELQEIGIQISLDDFGTGFSSLSCLSELPIDILKLDRSFIQNMFSTEGGNALVRAIVGLAKDLHISVVAEGIETREQLSYLRNLSCEYGQGYLLSKPISHDLVPGFCEDKPALVHFGLNEFELAS